MTATYIYNNETKSALVASHKIAVVNLDAGIKKGDKTIYYANKIIQYPSSNYQTVSLEEAKSGVENGRYAAYVLIPADFSESVNSINTTPKQAVFEYLINSYELLKESYIEMDYLEKETYTFTVTKEGRDSLSMDEDEINTFIVRILALDKL